MGFQKGFPHLCDNWSRVSNEHVEFWLLTKISKEELSCTGMIYLNGASTIQNHVSTDVSFDFMACLGSSCVVNVEISGEDIIIGNAKPWSIESFWHLESVLTSGLLGNETPNSDSSMSNEQCSKPSVVPLVWLVNRIFRFMDCDSCDNDPQHIGQYDPI